MCYFWIVNYKEILGNLFLLFLFYNNAFNSKNTKYVVFLGDALLPAWAIIVLIAFAELIVGGITYVALKKVIIDQPLTGTYSPAPLHASP